MWESMDVLNRDSSEVDVVVDITNIVRLCVVVPGYDLNNVGLNVVDGLLPAVVPESIAELDPVVRAAELLELPG